MIFFSHPAAFTPVCTTAFMTFARMQDEFRALNCELLGLSIRQHLQPHRPGCEPSKIEFRDMKKIEVTFPVISDLTMEVSKLQGMLQPSASSTQAARAVFFIDPESKIRAIHNYGLSAGRNFRELKRLLISLQTTDRYGVPTPADWQPGEEVIVPPPGSCGAARERVESKAPGIRCVDWFLGFQKLS